MKRVTYSKAQFDEAADLWERGDFSPEWEPWRRLAARGPGIIYPPDGDAYDSWLDDHPSQRAMLIRAIRETPTLLRQAILRAHRASWSAVLDGLLEERDEMRSIADADADAIERRRHEEPTPRQATYRLKEIFDMVRDS